MNCAYFTILSLCRQMDISKRLKFSKIAHDFWIPSSLLYFGSILCILHTQTALLVHVGLRPVFKELQEYPLMHLGNPISKSHRGVTEVPVYVLETYIRMLSCGILRNNEFYESCLLWEFKAFKETSPVLVHLNTCSAPTQSAKKEEINFIWFLKVRKCSSNLILFKCGNGTQR